MSESTKAEQPTIIYGSGRKPDAAIPRPDSSCHRGLDCWCIYATAFTPPEKRTGRMRAALRLSDELVDEFFTADLIVAGIPFYNFGMPSGFKAYIDQIVRVGRTFAFNRDNKEAPFQPLTFGQQLIAIVSRGDGGFGPGGRNETRNHLDPHPFDHLSHWNPPSPRFVPPKMRGTAVTRIESRWPTRKTRSGETAASSSVAVSKFESSYPTSGIRNLTIGDVVIEESQRKFRWSAPGPCPKDDPGIPTVE